MVSESPSRSRLLSQLVLVRLHARNRLLLLVGSRLCSRHSTVALLRLPFAAGLIDVLADPFRLVLHAVDLALQPPCPLLVLHLRDLVPAGGPQANRPGPLGPRGRCRSSAATATRASSPLADAPGCQDLLRGELRRSSGSYRASDPGHADPLTR